MKMERGEGSGGALENPLAVLFVQFDNWIGILCLERIPLHPRVCVQITSVQAKEIWERHDTGAGVTLY